MTFRLLTYNILKGGAGRVQMLANVINSCAPDLVLLQEATNPDTVEQLAKLTQMGEWRTYLRQSLGFLSRSPVKHSQWLSPPGSRHAFLEVVPQGDRVRVFGVHLSAVLAAWTERKREEELRALLKAVDQHKAGFHVLTGDFNTIAPGEEFKVGKLPMRLRPLMWITGNRVRWRTIQTVLDAGYTDAFRALHPGDPGMTLPTVAPLLRLDYVFVPASQARRVVACEVVKSPEAIGASDHFPVVADLALDG
jgi:endonuclease/exonuclease/phosphatase family metal-dependent hydrolase